MTKAGSRPSRIYLVTLSGPRLAAGLRLQPVAVAFTLESKGGDLSAETELMAFFPFGKFPLQPAVGNKVLKVGRLGGWFARGQPGVRESRQMAFELWRAVPGLWLDRLQPLLCSSF